MDSWCKGCNFHQYPYKAQVPLAVDGKYEVREFHCDDDIKAVINLLIKETRELNERGNKFDVAMSVSKQLPHFSCINIVYSNEAQLNIEKYLYCKEFGISPHSGSYKEQPKKWIDRVFLIKRAFAKKEESLIKKSKKEMNNG